MKLNQDCIREILLYLECNLKLNGSNDSYTLSQKIINFNKEEILYAIEKLAEANYISAIRLNDLGGKPMYVIRGLTWEGHEFLDNIRNPQIWSETKNYLKISGAETASLEILSQIAVTIVAKSLNI